MLVSESDSPGLGAEGAPLQAKCWEVLSGKWEVLARRPGFGGTRGAERAGRGLLLLPAPRRPPRPAAARALSRSQHHCRGHGAPRRLGQDARGPAAAGASAPARGAARYALAEGGARRGAAPGDRREKGGRVFHSPGEVKPRDPRKEGYDSMGGVPPNKRPWDRSWGHNDNELEATREVRVPDHSGPRNGEGPWIWVLSPLLPQIQGSRPQLLEWLPREPRAP